MKQVIVVDTNMTKFSLRVCSILFLLQFVFLNSAQAESESRKTIITANLARLEELRNTRIIKQPNGPFAAMVFDEDAQAIHTCLIYYEPMGVPVRGKWSISERAWCNDKWGSGVTSLYWCPDGKCLFVATSTVYGDGGVFKLDLYTKTFVKVYPTAQKGQQYVSSTEIIGSEKDRLRLKVEFSEIDQEKGKLHEARVVEEKEVVIPLRE